MHQRLKKCAGCNDRLLRVVADPEIGDDSTYLSTLDNELAYLALLEVEMRLLFEGVFHSKLVSLFVALCSWAANARTFAGIKHSDLDGGCVGIYSHLTAKGIDFTDDMPLSKTPDGRVTTHLADAIQIHSEEHSFRAHPGRS